MTKRLKCRPQTIFFLSFFVSALSVFATEIRFQRACDAATTTLKVGAVGDILFHSPLVRQVLARSEGALDILKPVLDLLRLADVNFGNLEGPVSPSQPLGLIPNAKNFNFPARVLNDLEGAGFHVLSTANNHTYDRGARGVSETLREFAKTNLLPTGTSSGTDPDLYATAILTKNGFTLAFVGCTAVGSGPSQVRSCSARDRIGNEIEALAARPDIDAVIVTPHWGTEYQNAPSSEQRNLGRFFLEKGATAVIGAHPHVLQPIEKVEVQGQEKFIAYSLGNFLSNQIGMRDNTAKITTAYLVLGLSRGPTGKAWVNGVRYVPVIAQYAPSEDRARGSHVRIHPLDSQDNEPARRARAHIAKLFPAENSVPSNSVNIKTNPECL